MKDVDEDLVSGIVSPSDVVPRLVLVAILCLLSVILVLIVIVIVIVILGGGSRCRWRI